MNTVKGIIIIFLMTVSTLTFAQSAKRKSWKYGIMRPTTAVTYTYETTRLEFATDATPATEVKAESSGSVTATEGFIEYMMFQGHMGIEFDLGLSPGTRHFTLTTTSKDDEETKIGDVQESVSISYALGVNFYAFDQSEGGFKPFAGYLLMSPYTIIHSYSNGGDRDDDEEDTLLAVPASQSSTLSLSSALLKIGVDYLFETAGIRIQMIPAQGEVVSEDGLPETEHNEPQVQKETVTLSGGMSIGVFGTF